MKVKLLVPICGPAGSFKAGDKPDLPEALAKALIKDGHAISLEIKTPEIKVEKLAEVKSTIEVKTSKKIAHKK